MVMQCGQCGAEYNRKNQKFCHKCGSKLGEQVDKIICPNCNRRTPAIPRCNMCGVIRSNRDILIFQHLTRLNDRLDSIDNRIDNAVSIFRSLKTGTVEYEDIELDRVDITPQETPITSMDEIESPAMAEAISQPEISEHVEEIEHSELEPEAIEVGSTSIEQELLTEAETVIEEEEALVEEISIAKPILPIPTLFPFKLRRQQILKPIPLPNRGRQSTTILDIPFKVQLKEFIEGPLLTSIGIFSLILALLYFGEGPAGTEPDPLTKSITYTIGGVLIIILGYLMIEDKFPLIKGSQYYLGTLFVITGFLLGISQNIVAVIEDDQTPIIFISLLIIITAWIGYKNESITTLSLVTIIGLIIPQILANSKFDWSILLFGGGLLWMIPIAIFTTTIGLKEKSYVPAILMLAIGPSVGISIINLWNQPETTIISRNELFPALGIVVSVFPVAILLMRGRIEMIGVYMRSLYGLLYTWPLVAFIAQFYNSDDIKFGIFNPLILFVGLSVAYHISTATLYGDYKGSELIRTTSLQMDKITRYFVPIIGFIAVTNALFSGEIEIDSGIASEDEFILTIILPAALFILTTGTYALLSNLKLLSFGSEGSAILTIILVEYTILSMGFKVSESIFYNSTASLFIVAVLITTLSGGILAHGFRNYFSRADNVLLTTCIVTLINSFIFLLSDDVLQGNWAITASFVGFIIFAISMLLPKLEDYERIRLNQIGLFGNFSLLALVQLYSDKYESTDVTSFLFLDVNQKYLIGPLVVFSIYVFMAILTGLVLHKFIIKRKVGSDEIPAIFGFSSEHSNRLVRFLINFEQKLLEFQEISLSAFINVLFLIFALTDGFGSGSQLSSEVTEDNISIIVLMTLTPIFLVINFITRKGSWLTLIPSLVTLYIVSLQLRDQAPENFKDLMVIIHVILGSYIILSMIISRLDRVNDHPRHFIRANARNISFWITQLLILNNAGSNNYWETVFLSVLLLQFTSAIIDLTRGEFYATGLTLLISSIFLSRIKTESEIAVMLSLFSIALISVIFIYQYLRTDVSKTDKIKIPIWLKDTLKALEIDSKNITSNTIITIRNVLPAVITTFILFPSEKDTINSKLPWDIDVNLIFLGWMLILSILTIALAEFSGFKSKNALFTIPIFIIPLFFNHASNEASKIENTNIIAILGVILLNSYFLIQSLKISKEGQRYKDIQLGIIVALTSIPAYIYFEEIIVEENLAIPVFLLSTSLILLYQLHFISEDKYAAIPSTLFFSIIAFLPLDEFVYSNVSLSLLPYIGLILVNIHQGVIADNSHYYTEILTSASFAIQFIFNFELFNIQYYTSSEFFEPATTILLILILASIIIFEWKNSHTISETSSGLMIILAGYLYSTDYQYSNFYEDGLTWDGFTTPTTLFPILYLYQLIKIYIHQRRVSEIDAKSIIPIIITASLYFVTIKFESQFTFAIVMSIGLMTILLEYLDKSNSNGLISMGYIWAIIYIWLEGQEISELDSNPYFVSSLLLLPLILFLIVKSEAQLFDRWLLYIASSVTFTGILFIKQIIGIEEPLNVGYLSLVGLFAMSYIVWAAREERFSLLNIYNFAAIALVLSNADTNENSFFPVIVFAGNIVYMFFNLFSKSEKIARSRSFSFGAVVLFLGAWFGSSETIWDILKDPDNPSDLNLELFNQFWMVLYLIWLAASILEILSAGIEFRNQDFYIKLQGETDAFAFTWFAFFAVETFWRGMINAESVLWIMVATAIVSLLITILRSSMRLNEDPNFTFLIGSYVIFTLFSGFFLSNNSFLDSQRRPKTTNFDLLGDVVRFVDVMNLMILTPLALAIFIMTYRSVSSLGDINADRLLIGLISIVFIPFAVYFDRFGSENYATILVPGLIFTWTTLLIGARKQNYQITTITSIMLYAQVIVLTFTLDSLYPEGGLSAWIVASMITTLLVFFYIVRVEINGSINDSHQSVLLVTIAVQIISILAMHLESEDLDVVITVVTASLAILGAIVYVYGIKFVRSRYTNIGMGITWMNLLKSGYHFLSRILTDRERGEEGELLSFISFITVAIMIFVIRGFGTISKQDDLKGVLRFLFEPVKREDES